MTLYPRHLVLLVVAAAGQRISGKTYLQKTCFFVGTLLGETRGFRDFYWGPYSDDVSAEITTLTAVGYLRQERRRRRDSRGHGWEDPCDYSVTAEGQRAVEYVRNVFADEWVSVNEALRKIEGAAGAIDYIGLSLAAQTCWLVQKRGPTPIEQVVEQVQEFWPVDQRQVEEARRFLENLCLAPQLFARH